VNPIETDRLSRLEKSRIAFPKAPTVSWLKHVLTHVVEAI